MSPSFIQKDCADRKVPIYFLLSLFIVGLVSYVITPSSSDLNAILSFPFVLLILFLIGERVTDDAIIRYVTLAVFTLLVLIGVINNCSHLFYPPQPDAALYDRAGWAIAQSLASGESLPWQMVPSLKRQIYSIFTGFMYYFTDHSYVIMQIINSFFTALALLNVARISELLLSRFISRYSFLIACLYPSLYFTSAAHLRGALILFATTEMVYWTFHWLDDNEVKSLLKSLGASVGVFIMRTENLLLVVIFYSEVILKQIFMAKGSSGRRQAIATAMIVLVIFSLLYLLTPAKLLIEEKMEWFKLKNINYRRNSLAKNPQNLENPGVTKPLRFENWGDVLTYTPRSILSFLFKRFPWKMSNWNYTRSWVSSLYILILIISCVGGVWKGIKINPEKVIILVSFLLISATILGIYDNVPGIIRRHRMPLIVLFTPFSGYIPFKLCNYIENRKLGDLI